MREEKRRYQIKKCDVEENLEVIGLRMFIIIDFGRNRFRCERGLRAPPEARVVEEEEKINEDGTPSPVDIMVDWE